ncbi:hypothetical protein SLE2022_275090 [Rubroshorea leprosula]
MSILCWNCRGLGNPRAVRSLIELVGLKKPAVVFLCETLLDGRGMDRIRQRLRFHNCFTVDKIGRSGGLVMLWTSEVSLSLLSYSTNHIDMEVEGMGGCKWRLTGYYGCPERHRRRRSWALLRELASRSLLPWLICGDFNDILRQDEKVGGDAQPEWLLAGFNDAIEACSLTELRMVGGSFTWQRGEIREKLDRGLATTRWHDTFPHAIVRLLPPLASDHKPLWISIDGRRDRRNWHRKRFRFEEMWLRDNRCQEVVQASWKSIEGTGDWGCLLHKMRVCSNDLLQWNRVQFGHVQTHLKQCMKEFKRLSHHQDPALAAREERRVLNELEEWLERGEIMWRQRSRDIWIQEGDRNTRFFHRRATKRKDRNRVEKLMKDTGEWTSSFGEVKVVVTGYFAQLFTSTDPTNLALVTDCLKPCVQDGDNSFLLHEFTEAEVMKALFQMHPSKSPGPEMVSPQFSFNAFGSQ